MGLIGDMRERVRIASIKTVRGRFNDEEKSWELSDELWAKVEVKTAGTDETFIASQKTPDSRVLFTMHMREVSQRDEIDYRGLRYQIVGLVPDQRRQFLTIETRQINPT